MSRPVPLHLEKHPEFVEGCFGCKAMGITFGAVPGGARKQAKVKTHAQKVEANLHRYREKRRAGERPDGTTKEAMDKSERKQDTWARHEQDIKDNHPPEVVKKVKRSLTNVE